MSTAARAIAANRDPTGVDAERFTEPPRSPVWDWRIRHVREAPARHRCPLPPEYEWFGHSFDGWTCGSSPCSSKH